MKPILKQLKKPDASSKLVLEEIIGLTTKNQNGLSSALTASHFAYLAGCVVVLFNVDSGSQSHLIVSHRTPKPLNCVSVSKDGRFVAAAELGNQPAVLVWNCSTLAFVSELKGHLYGIECIAFSPDGEHLVSVGGYICLWNWKTGELVTKLKASSSCSTITSVSFLLDAKFIVTAGKKHLKFWAVGSSLRTHLNKGTESPALHGKPVDLGPQKGSSFVSVTSAVSTSSAVNSEKVGDLIPIYALTSEGVLCLLDSSLSVRKSVNLRVEKAFALSTSDKLIACACCNGTVLIFICETLHYAGKLLYSKAKSIPGGIDTLCHTGSTEKDADVSTLPDALACQFSASEKLVIIYGDHNLHIWDIHNVNMATRCYVSVSHSAYIWDVKNLCCENMHDPHIACVARGCFGGVSFATCSADGSIRLWDLSLQPDVAERHENHFPSNTKLMNTAYLVSSGIFERDSVETGVSSQGFRSIAPSSDGKYLAAGDCKGNLHIYNLFNSDYTCFQGVHETEILTMSFSSLDKNSSSDKIMDGNYLLATGGRDRIIHVYDAKRNFDIVGSIDDHSAAVTSVKLIHQGCKILSCSADRSLVFRDVAVRDNSLKILRRQHQMASNGTVYDMAVDPMMDFVFTVGQDKKINTFNIASGKLTRLFRQNKDFGDPIKVTMDPSCSYLICSYSDKSICMYDIINGEMVMHSMGHGEVVTGIIFLPDCKHVVSVSGDSCIFVWKLPTHISSRILQRIKKSFVPLSPTNLNMPYAFSQFKCSQKEDQLSKINPQDACLLENSSQVGKKVLYQGSQKTPTFRFSISRLPNWAQAKVASSGSAIKNPHLTFSLPHQLVELKVVSPMVSGGEEFGSSSCEVHSSAGLDVGDTGSCLSNSSKGSSDTKDNQNSPMPEDTLGCFAMDKCWRNVYTVYLDLLNSPEVKNLMDVKMAVPSSNLKTVNSNGRCFWQADHLLDDRHGASSKRQASSSNSCCQHDDQFGMSNSKFHEKFSDHAAEKLHMDKSKIQMAESTEFDQSHTESEDSDLFRQHFSNLSARAETSKSSTKRKYPARYIVRRDRHEGCKRLFSTPVREAALKRTSENIMFQTLKDKQEGSSCKEMNSVQYISISSDDTPQYESSELLLAENSLNCSTTQCADRKECIAERSNLQERITECRKALLNLDTAADNVLHLFSEFGALASTEKISSGPEAKLHDEAVQLLPSIAEKLNAFAKMVQCSSFSLSNKVSNEVSGFETMLGSVAESLSERIVEVLKNNLIKDELLHNASQALTK